MRRLAPALARASESAPTSHPQVTNERDRPPRGRSIDEYLKLFRGSFAEVEWAAIDGRESGDAPRGDGGGVTQRQKDDDEAARWARFYRHWSLKEAYIKAHGQGLGHKVERLVFRCGSARDRRRVRRGRALPAAL